MRCGFWQLYPCKASDGNKKLPHCRFCTVGIVREFCRAPTPPPDKHHHHGDRGSSGSPPPFFSSGGKLKNRRAKKERKKGRTADWPCHHFCHAPISLHPPPRPPPLSNNPHPCAIQSPIMAMSLHGAHCVACGDVAIIGDSVTLPAILFWKNPSEP
jgi:hypothetical protein